MAKDETALLISQQNTWLDKLPAFSKPGAEPEGAMGKPPRTFPPVNDGQHDEQQLDLSHKKGRGSGVDGRGSGVEGPGLSAAGLEDGSIGESAGA